MKTKKKRYFLSVVEEMVMNPEYSNIYRGGRIEVYDRNSKTGYAIYEARIWIPIELMDKFREVFDFVEVDHLPRIEFDCKET